jgi:hypothetical protein
MTTILIKKKDTAGAPAPGDLTNAAGGTEIAVNTATKRIYTKDSSGNVVELGTNSTSSTIDQLTVVTSTTLSYGTANQVQYLNASKLLVGSANLTFDGTTLTPNALTVTNAVTLSGGTANGVTYLNGSKVLTSGTALTFDASNFKLTGADNNNLIWSVNSNAGAQSIRIQANVAGLYLQGSGTVDPLYITQSSATGYIVFRPASDTEGMRLTSTGLGIGTTSPVAPVTANRGNVSGAGQWASSAIAVANPTNTGSYSQISFGYTVGTTNASAYMGFVSTNQGTNGYGDLVFGTRAVNTDTQPTERLRLDSAGNLGLGVTPSAATFKTLQIGNSSNVGSVSEDPDYNDFSFGSGCYFDTTWKYTKTGEGASLFRAYGYDGQFFWQRAGSGTAGNTISFTTAMVLDASGNLGVGTSSPSQKLHVLSASTTATVAKFAATNYGNLGTTYIEIGTQNGDGGSRIGSINPTGNQSTLVFETMTASSGVYAERARIDNDGNLLVGTTTARGIITVDGLTSPTRPGLYVYSYPTSNPSAVIYRANTDAQYGLVVRHDGPVIGSGGTGYMIQFQDRNGGALGTITSSGTGAGTTAYNTSSDYRLKNTIAPMTGALAKVATLKPVTYKWNADNSDGQGFIAHELQEVFPEAVAGVKDEMESYTNDEGVVMERPRYQGIDTSFLVATLTAAIQEQQALIVSLTARLDAANL